MRINVFTIDGIPEFTFHSPVDPWTEFDYYVATYIDTEGQPAGSGGYVVQLIDDDGNILAEENQQSYTL